MIKVEGLRKIFRRPVTYDGRLGRARSLFTRQFNEVVAVDRVDFTIGAGEIVGYLGPNGSGKSTTIKMVSGVLRPTAGLIQVNRLSPWRDRKENARRIGAVFGQRSQLWWDLPLVESFRIIAAIYDMQPLAYMASLDELTNVLDMGSFLNTPVRQLSLGQRMRGDLAAAVLHRPSVLYLDEPTVGLDVIAKEAAREFIGEMSRTGRTTIVLTTHDIADVDALCRRIILIDQGRVLHDGDAQELQEMYGVGRRLIVQLAEAGPEEFIVKKYRAVRMPGQQYEFSLDERSMDGSPSVTVPEILAHIATTHGIRDVRIMEPKLEGVIKEVYMDRHVR